MANIKTLVRDIYKLMSTKETKVDDPEELIEAFGERCKDIMRKEFTKKKSYGNGGNLRLSQIGKTDRQLWYAFNGLKGEKIAPHTYIKFLYGHLIEEMVLLLVKLSGHEVEDEQKVCHVEGVKGHMDCRIDGVLVDVKSASTYSFKKFREGRLHEDDPFGYIDQIKGYAHSEGDKEYGWLAFDKQNGHLCTLLYNEDDHEFLQYDIAEKVKRLKKMVRAPVVPSDYCHDLEEDGSSGNLKLSVGCSYCAFKRHCYPDLKVYQYSHGVKFLAHIAKEPRVKEVELEDDF